VRYLIAKWRVLMNCSLAGMLAGTGLAVGVHWLVSHNGTSGRAGSEVWLRSPALVLVGGFVGLFWGVAHLTVEDLDAGTQGRQDYDDSISRNCPPGST
jgi:hypothetical protein